MKYKNLYGNHFHKNHSDKMWNSWSWDLGFSGKEEMLSYLRKDCTLKAIAKLLGVAISTVHYQLRKLGIKKTRCNYGKEN